MIRERKTKGMGREGKARSTREQERTSERQRERECVCECKLLSYPQLAQISTAFIQDFGDFVLQGDEDECEE